jgi:hypothetical protein
MDGLARTVGNGIAGLVVMAFDAIGGTLRWIVGSASNAVPGLTLPILVFGALVVVAWILAKR